MRGIDAVPGRDYLEADTVEEFAQKILDVLSERVLADRLSANGVAVAERYDWNTIGEKLFEVRIANKRLLIRSFSLIRSIILIPR